MRIQYLSITLNFFPNSNTPSIEANSLLLCKYVFLVLPDQYQAFQSHKNSTNGTYIHILCTNYRKHLSSVDIAYVVARL